MMRSAIKSVVEKTGSSESEPTFYSKQVETEAYLKRSPTRPRYSMHPIIYVIGHDPQCDGKIFEYLDCLPIVVRWTDEVEHRYLEKYADKIETVIVIQGVRDRTWVESQLQRLSQLPVPCVGVFNQDMTTGEAATWGYQQGVDILFSSSRCLSDLPRYVATFITHKSKVEDDKGSPLARAIELKIKLEPHFNNEVICVEENAGHVRVHGLVTSLWKWQFLCDMLRVFPGVLSLNVSQLTLDAKPVKNKDACEILWDIVHDDSHAPDETLLMSVSGDCATLTGVLPSGVDINALLKQLGRNNCINEVRGQFIESNSYQQHCQERARKIYTQIERLHVPNAIRVSVCGSRVVLSGFVEDLELLDRISGTCMDEDDTEYVLNTCSVGETDYPYVG